MFGVGTGELMLLMLVALIVLGPERMPKIARDIGRTMADLRRTSDELREQLLVADLKPVAPPAPESAYNREEREARERIRLAASAEAASAALAAAPPPEAVLDRELREARARLAAASEARPLQPEA